MFVQHFGNNVTRQSQSQCQSQSQNQKQKREATKTETYRKTALGAVALANPHVRIRWQVAAVLPVAASLLDKATLASFTSAQRGHVADIQCQAVQQCSEYSPKGMCENRAYSFL